MDDIYKKCVDPSCFDRDPSTKTLPQYPPDRTELGKAGWLFLHSFSTRYPEKPDEDSKLTALGFLYSFANMYPCSICRDSLVEFYRRFPPRVDSRRNLVLWTAHLHNLVNKDIGKDPEVYTYEQLMEKYSG